MGLHLVRYNTVPHLETNQNSLLQSYAFRIGVKEDAPLFVKYGVKEVSISFHPDSRTLEILLWEQEGRKDDKPFDDVKRFDTVGELMVFLDNMEHYIEKEERDSSDSEEEEEEEDDKSCAYDYRL